MIMFTRPEFKKTYYAARTRESIQNDIFDVSIHNIKKLHGDKGYILTLCINFKDIEYFKKIDEEIIETLSQNSSEWFKKELDKNTIDNLYKLTVCKQNNTIDVLLTNKCILYINNKELDIENFINNIRNIVFLRKSVININIHHCGIYIYSTYTCNKWIAKNIHIYVDDDIETDTKYEIDESWKNMALQCNEILDLKIRNIQETQNKINNLYKEIIQEKNRKAWEEKIISFKKLIQNIIF